jgi:ATP-binding cassette, subfamily B, bacterial MsbA
MKQLTKVHEKWQQALTIANILIELENYPLELVQLSIPLKNYNYDFLNKTSRLEFKNVSFYSPGEDGAQILRNISFTVEPGQTVAIVGPSGGGKSSLVSLVSRFYDYQGSITLDGVELRSIPLAQLRNSIGYVSQQITIFHDTVEANIAYGASNPDLSNIYKAATLAFAHDFIEQLPLGYQTILGSNQGGYKLSGGQRQRLALARVFYKQAPLIILDEATSALDNESEDKIQASLMNLVATASTLVVAHRLSTVINADKILVIDKGQIVEEGSHNELIKLGGLYASLYATAKKENAFA